MCAVCNQPITEIVVRGRTFVARVPASLNAPEGTSRYLTILHVACGCGERIVRRYENSQSRETSASRDSLTIGFPETLSDSSVVSRLNVK